MMQNRIVQLMILSFILCFCLSSTYAESDLCVDRKLISDLLRKNDISKIESIVARLEEVWDKTRNRTYFESMNTICQELADYTSQNTSLFSELLKFSRLLVVKEMDVQEVGRGVMYLNQIKVTQMLLELLTNKALPHDQKWQENRSHVMRLAAIVCRRIQIAYNDPKTRADCEESIQNEATILENDNQKNQVATVIVWEQFVLLNILADIMQSDWLQIERVIVEAYSMEPLAREELSEYLQLGSFNNQDRRRILDAMMKKIKVQSDKNEKNGQKSKADVPAQSETPETKEGG